MKRYFVKIPRQWASFECSCVNDMAAVQFFAEVTKHEPFASLLDGRGAWNERNKVAYKENGKLITCRGWHPNDATNTGETE